MKKLVLFSLFAFIINCSLSAQQIAVNSPVTETQTASTKITWDKTTFDFGEIPQDRPAEAQFKLTNNGKEALIVTDVKRT